MKLRSRKKLQKVGISQHTAEDYFDGDFVELSAFEQENDITFDYTAGSKRKIRQKSRDGVEEPEPQQRDVQNAKSKVKTLLETPYEEIDYKKLSVAHLRLSQEARERITGKETLPGPSSNTRVQKPSQLLFYRHEDTVIHVHM